MHESKQTPTAATTRRRRRIIAAGIAGVGICLTAACVITIGDWYTTTHHAQPPSPHTTITYSSNKPNETPIHTNQTPYEVPGDQPRLLDIPSIGVHNYIQRVGLDQHNAVATPNSIYIAGWYTGSAKPGDAGVSLIDGHVHGRFSPGIFNDLHLLKTGDDITVEYGDKTRITFQVVKTQAYNTDEAAAHMLEKLPSVDRELVLITCTGTFNRATDSYNQRLLVYATKTQ